MFIQIFLTGTFIILGLIRVRFSFFSTK